ncbi:secreted frizzled-related protein 1-like [Lineus longissimus]|uniref:secreted frizzled-related protein 1-like n=1 Tax=Lineus longissimus TaxID=88925 RepID=UPI002B4F3FA6
MAYTILRCVFTVVLPLISASPAADRDSSSVIETSDSSYYEDRAWSDTYMADWSNPDWALISGRSQQRTCVDIPANLTLCQNLGYQKMVLPNLLGHDSLGEVTQQAGSWVSLQNIKCHRDTQLFLCSLFAPVCLDRLIWPCRSLCEAVKAGCVSRMNSYGFPWPDMLRCDKFPLENDLCITSRSPDGNKDNKDCPPCKEPDTVEGIVDNFCRAQFVMKVKGKKVQTGASGLELTAAKKMKMFKKEKLKKRFLQKPLSIGNGADCTCQRLNITEERNYLVMGNIVNKKPVVSAIFKWSGKKKSTTRQGLKASKKKDVCKGGVSALENVDSMKTKRDKKKGKKKGRGKGKRRDREPKKTRRPRYKEMFFRK